MKLRKPVIVLFFIVLALGSSVRRAASEGIVPWFRVSDVPHLQDTPGVAANTLANQFLVVWEDWRGAGAGTDLYAQLVNSDGSMDGGNFSIAVAEDWQRGPALDYSPMANKYLVVWEDWRSDDIYGRLVNANGTTSGAQFPIAAAAEYQWNPDLAYGATPNQYLVVFDDDRLVPGDQDIYGQRVNADGSLSGSNFAISAPSADQLLPAVAYNATENQYLVIWEDERNPASEADIYGRLVNANGSFDGGDFAISTAGADQGYPDVAYAPSANRYLAVWEQSNDVYGRLINADKTFPGAAFRIASSSGSLSSPVVSYDPYSDQFLVAWSDSTGWDDIYAQQVGIDGGLSGGVLDLITGTGDDQNPAITNNSSTHQFMVAWQRQTCHDTFCDDYDKDIYGAMYQATGHHEVNLPVMMRQHQPSPPPEPTATMPGPTSTPVTPSPTATQTPTPTATPGPQPWETILIDGFEGAFPGSWTVHEGMGSGPGEYHWGKRTCRPFTGSYSAWAVGGGANGSLLGCGGNYPNDAVSWMYYGPFSLVGATDAEFRFSAWINTELTYDYVCRLASLDGVSFSGDCTSGDSGGWITQILDLSNVTDLGNVLGQPNVWVGLYFFSDGSIVDQEGVYVDDILLRKCTTGGCTSANEGPPVAEDPDLITFPRSLTLSPP